MQVLAADAHGAGGTPPPPESLEQVHVGAGAVALARTGDDDHPDRVVAIGAERRMPHFGAHAHRPRIQLVRPVRA